ncbi:MAG: hypothetical protein M3280_06165 [Actinomycetota bacterium]|nr:hypothetical protein [Actinomycetota bacterium]
MNGRATKLVMYWAFTFVLIAVGIVGIFSIGIPFLLLGITLAILFPARDRPAFYWAGVMGVAAFIAGFILLAPLGCTSSVAPVTVSVENPRSDGAVPLETPTPVVATECANPIGIDYKGSVGYNPSFAPALLGGVALGVLVGVASHAVISRRSAATAAA